MALYHPTRYLGPSATVLLIHCVHSRFFQVENGHFKIIINLEWYINLIFYLVEPHDNQILATEISYILSDLDELIIVAKKF